MKLRLTLSFCAEQQRLIECVAQFDGHVACASEEGNSDGIRSDLPAGHEMSTSRKSDVDDTVEVSEVGRSVKKDNRGVVAVANRDFLRRDLFGPTGIISHGVFSTVESASPRA